ncbi:MAG: glycosyltransferase family 1 protein [Desulfobacteraceae bacterium]|nr:MAG: glycosyltransferase family 1 protein [Desulfobacteraceae bacterium]
MKIGISATSTMMISGFLDGINEYTSKLICTLRNQNGLIVKPFVFKPVRYRIDFERFKHLDGHISRMPFSFNMILGQCLHISLEECGVADLDIYHATDHRVPYFKNIPVVANIHDAVPIAFPEWTNKSFRKTKNVLLKRSFRWANRVICLSRTAQKEVIKYWAIPESITDVVYLAADEGYFYKINKSDKIDILGKHGLEDKCYFLTVGTIQPRKNQENLIKAYRMLSSNIRKYMKLVLVGNYGWGCSHLKDLLTDEENRQEIIWLQNLSKRELAALYQGSLCFIFPSLYEGFGMPIVEAFASETPVIASNLSCIPEIAGNSAILVDPYNTQEMSRIMRELALNDKLRENLIEKGIQRAKDFSWKKCAEETIQVYKKALYN